MVGSARSSRFRVRGRTVCFTLVDVCFALQLSLVGELVRVNGNKEYDISSLFK